MCFIGLPHPGWDSSSRPDCTAGPLIPPSIDVHPSTNGLQIARLFLVNDILHNSTAPVRNASRYRSKLELILPNIFESLQETYRYCWVCCRGGRGGRERNETYR